MVEMTTQVRERLEKELTKFVEQRRADYLGLKMADTQITSAELSSARTAYERVRDDIILMLRDSGSDAIDAKTKFGVITSDFEGNPHPRRYRLGERYATSNSPSSCRIHLRMGFGGITLKAVPPEADVSPSTR